MKAALLKLWSALQVTETDRCAALDIEAKAPPTPLRRALACVAMAVLIVAGSWLR